MERIYINGDEVRFIKKDFCLTDAEFYDGRSFNSLEPRRLFPVSGLRKYITLLNTEGKEVAVIRDLDALMPESRKVIEECLDEYYFIPRITEILNISDKKTGYIWTVETDRGQKTFKVRNRYSDVKMLYDGRILFLDTDDNRYEIPSIKNLDLRSQKLISNEI